MKNYNLGRVAFVDKGAYSSTTTYNKWDFVTTSDSTYLYINDNPQSGTSVTDTNYWKCLADGKQATAAASNANTVATNVANAEAQRVASGSEVKTNKQNSLATDGTGIKYPTVDAINGILATSQNQIKNSRFLFFDDVNNPITVFNQAGTPTYTIEDSIFATKQMHVICKIGDRLQIKYGITITSGNKYSLGFYYQVITGSKKPYIYDPSVLTSNALTKGTVKETAIQGGWVFSAMENCTANSNYANTGKGFLIDIDNTGGTEQCEFLIAMPMMIPYAQIPQMIVNGYDFAFSYISSKLLSIDNANWNWNLISDAGMYLVDSLSNGIKTNNKIGTSTFVYEKNIFGGQQTHITTPAGARGQLIAPFNIEANKAYSFGFFYKVIAGTISPIDSSYVLSTFPGNTSLGKVSVVSVKDGWMFYKRENITYNQSSNNSQGLYMDLDNTGGSTTAEVLIALPILMESTTLNPVYSSGTFDALINIFGRVKTLENGVVGNINEWGGKNLALYGDSITGISNGDFVKGAYNLNTWGGIVANYLGMNKLFCRGVGAQTYSWKTHGGSVVFLDQTTGQYVDRNDSYNYDNYTGAIPANCIKTRGAFCSWNRITSTFPASIKDTINCVIIMGATNDDTDATDLSWLNADTTDPEWHASTYYATYGGDFNINTLKGGIASTILKMQAWMPQAIIIIATPLPGRSTAGNINLVPVTPEVTKSIYVRDVAKTFSIPLIDVNANSGINGLNSPTYITDGIHPYSTAGNKMLARTMIEGLKQIMPNL
jgi:hypothetical protein